MQLGKQFTMLNGKDTTISVNEKVTLLNQQFFFKKKYNQLILHQT